MPSAIVGHGCPVLGAYAPQLRWLQSLFFEPKMGLAETSCSSEERLHACVDTIIRLRLRVNAVYSTRHGLCPIGPAPTARVNASLWVSMTGLQTHIARPAAACAFKVEIPRCVGGRSHDKLHTRTSLDPLPRNTHR